MLEEHAQHLSGFSLNSPARTHSSPAKIKLTKPKHTHSTSSIKLPLLVQGLTLSSTPTEAQTNQQHHPIYTVTDDLGGLPSKKRKGCSFLIQNCTWYFKSFSVIFHSPLPKKNSIFGKFLCLLMIKR